MVSRACLALAILASVVCGALAAGKAEPRAHPLTNLPPAGDITTAHFFPEGSGKVFTAGQPVKVVLGIRNDASEKYNISAIMGSLNNAQDFRAYYLNFTQQLYFKVVEPSKELSVEYTLTTPKELPPNDYQVALTVFYEAADGFKSTTFFNETITVTEKKQLVDTGLLWLYMMMVGIVGVAGFYVWTVVKDSALYKSTVGKKSRKVEVNRADNDDEWVKGTPYDNFVKSKAKAAGKGSKKAQ